MAERVRRCDLSRRAEDPATLADAATLIRPSHNLALMARVHELCAEALARLGDADPVRAARLQAQLVATSNPFGPDRVELSGIPMWTILEASFLRLRARHAERLNPTHIGERLVLADAAIDLGRRTGMDEYICWGRRWRMDAYAELGNRLDLTAELAALTPIVERLGQPAWQAHAKDSVTPQSGSSSPCPSARSRTTSATSCTNWAAAPVPRWPAGTPAGPLIRTASRAGSGRHAGPSPAKPGGVLGSAAD